jgi:hypothetical protein
MRKLNKSLPLAGSELSVGARCRNAAIGDRVVSRASGPCGIANFHDQVAPSNRARPGAVRGMITEQIRIEPPIEIDIGFREELVRVEFLVVVHRERPVPAG